MDFGEILERWERGRGGGRGSDPLAAPSDDPGLDNRASSGHGSPGSKRDAPSGKRGDDDGDSMRRAFGDWLDEHGVVDKDAGSEGDLREDRRAAAAAIKRLAGMKPQESIDLHGLGAEAASVALEAFLRDAAQRGLEKVLVIHGKGFHSAGEPVLGKIARRIIEASPWAGRFDTAAREDGGTGALWVAIRPGRGRSDEGSEDYFSR